MNQPLHAYHREGGQMERLLAKLRERGITVSASSFERTDSSGAVFVDAATHPEEGLDFIRQIRTSVSPTQIIAQVQNGRAQDALSAGADDFVDVDEDLDAIICRIDLAHRRLSDQRALAQASAKLSALIENTPDFILFSDKSGSPVVYNKRYAQGMKELLGIEMRPGLKPHELLSDPEAKKVWDRFHERVLSGEQFSVEYEHPTPNGPKHFEVSFNPVRKDGEIIGFSEFSRDVTERHLAEQKLKQGLQQKVRERTQELEHANALLRESEKRYRQVYETAPLAFITWDRDCRILSWNRQAERMFGWSEEEVLGKNYFELIIPNGAKVQVEGVVEGLLQEKRLRRAINENCTKSGQTIICEWNNSVLLDANGEVICVLSLALDITERKTMEQRLRQAEKLEAVGQLAGGVAHDFNNQLVGIVGFGSLLLEELEDDTLRSYADGILKSAQRSTDLVSQLLAFARRGRIQFTPIDLNYLISEVISLLSRSIDKRIEIEQQSHPDPVIVAGDATLLQNVLLNLGLNARDAMTDGGTITFSTAIKNSTEGPVAQVRVVDNGRGMSEETRQHIFEPFFTTKSNGTGMGLAAAYGSVESHHGQIEVRSRKGYGTTFTIRLPIADEAPEVVHMPISSPSLRSGRVMIVDDEPIVCEVLGAILSDLGYDVLVFTDGESALAKYRESWKQIDLVILDLIMPKMDGSAVFRGLKKINAEAQVLLSSGYALDGRAQALLDAGAVGLLEKPYDRTKVTSLVRDLTETSRSIL